MSCPVSADTELRVLTARAETPVSVAAGIVPTFDILKDIGSRFGPRLVLASIPRFRLSRPTKLSAAAVSARLPPALMLHVMWCAARNR